MIGDKKDEQKCLLIEQTQSTGTLETTDKMDTHVEHKHELEYMTCRAERYLAGLGSWLWLWDDLHGDDTVGFFLQAKTKGGIFHSQTFVSSLPVSSWQNFLHQGVCLCP